MPQNRIPLNAESIGQGMKFLAKDRHLGALTSSLPAPLPNQKRRPFHALTVAILNQQISRIAAAAIEERLASLAGRPFTPEAVAAVDPASLKKAGLSASKIACVQACARNALAKELTARSCRNQSDEEIFERIVAIKGAGPWTAKMVLIFGLGRPDVMPHEDGGVQRAAKLLAGAKAAANPSAWLQEVSDQWRPHRTIAAWLLWRSLGN